MLRTIDEHGHHVGSRLALENQARNAPLEVPQIDLRVLVDQALGKDVYPGVSVASIDGGGGVGVGAGGGVGEGADGEGVGDVDC